MSKETKRNLIIVSAVAVALIVIVAVLLLLRPFSGGKGGSTSSTTTGTTGQTQDQQDTSSAGNTDTTGDTGGADSTEQTLGAVGGVGSDPDGGRGEQSSTTGGTDTDPDPSATAGSQTPENTTGSGEDNTVNTTDPDGALKDLTWEEWLALSPDQQDAYTFAYTGTYGFPAFSKWYKDAQADYAARHPEESVTGDPVIDIGG